MEFEEFSPKVGHFFWTKIGIGAKMEFQEFILKVGHFFGLTYGSQKVQWEEFIFDCGS